MMDLVDSEHGGLVDTNARNQRSVCSTGLQVSCTTYNYPYHFVNLNVIYCDVAMRGFWTKQIGRIVNR